MIPFCEQRDWYAVYPEHKTAFFGFLNTLENLKNIAGLLAKAKDSPMAIGVTVGLMAAAGNTGLALLGMVAAGIVLIYVADAVGKSLHELIPQWLRVAKSEGAVAGAPAGQAPPPAIPVPPAPPVPQTPSQN